LTKDICLKLRGREISNIRFSAFSHKNILCRHANSEIPFHIQTNLCFWKSSMNFPYLSELLTVHSDNQKGPLHMPCRSTVLCYYITNLHYANNFSDVVNSTLAYSQPNKQTQPLFGLRHARVDIRSSWFSIDPIILNSTFGCEK
jgi:hypothetical protein